MNVTIVTMYDQKAAIYAIPSGQKNAATATRWFTNLATSDGPIGDNPADFDLFELGTYDQDSGHYTLHDSPVHLGNALALATAADQSETVLKAANG